MDCAKERDDRCPPPPYDCTFEELKRNVTQCTDISLPIVIDPSAVVGRIKTEWCDEPIVVCHQDPCEKSCKVTISQRVCVTIPVTYSVLTCVEDPTINCCAGDSCGLK